MTSPSSSKVSSAGPSSMVIAGRPSPARSRKPHPLSDAPFTFDYVHQQPIPPGRTETFSDSSTSLEVSRRSKTLSQVSDTSALQEVDLNRLVEGRLRKKRLSDEEVTVKAKKSKTDDPPPRPNIEVMLMDYQSDSSADFTESEGGDSEAERKEDEDDIGMESDSSDEWVHEDVGGYAEEAEEGSEGSGGSEDGLDGSNPALECLPPTLRAVGSNMLYMQRRIDRLEKTLLPLKANKARAGRISRQLEAERFVSARYRHLVQSLQQQLVSIMESKEHLEQKLKKALAPQLEAEKRAKEAEEALALVKEASDQQRGELVSARDAAEGERAAAMTRALSAEVRLRVMEKKYAQLEVEVEGKRKETLTLGSLLNRTRAELGAAAQNLSAMETERLQLLDSRQRAEDRAQNAETELVSARQQTAHLTAQLAQAVSAHSDAQSGIANISAYLESARAETELAREQIRAQTSAWAPTEQQLQGQLGQAKRLKEEAYGKISQSQAGHKEAEKRKEELKSALRLERVAADEIGGKLRVAEGRTAEVERKLGMMREAHEMEREMYVQKIRTLSEARSGASKVKVERE